MVDWYSDALVTRDELRGWGARKPDAQLDLAIAAVSQRVQEFLGRPLLLYKRTAEPSTNPALRELEPEEVSGSGHVLLRLTHYPIQTVSKVTICGAEITGWKLLPEYACRGRLYHGEGWPQPMIAVGDLTGDLVGSEHKNIVVEYTGGYEFARIPGAVKIVVIRECLTELAGDGRSHPSLIEEDTPGQWRQKWSAGGGVGASGLSLESEAKIAYLRRIV